MADNRLREHQFAVKNAQKRSMWAFLTQSDHQIQTKGAYSLKTSLVITALYVIH